MTNAPAGIFIPYTLIDVLGGKNMGAVILAATIAHLHHTEPYDAPDGTWVRMPVRQLAAASHLTVGQVRRATDLLVDVGILERSHHQIPGADPGRVPYSYRLRPDISNLTARSAA